MHEVAQRDQQQPAGQNRGAVGDQQPAATASSQQPSQAAQGERGAAKLILTEFSGTLCGESQEVIEYWQLMRNPTV